MKKVEAIQLALDIMYNEKVKYHLKRKKMAEDLISENKVDHELIPIWKKNIKRHETELEKYYQAAEILKSLAPEEENK